MQCWWCGWAAPCLGPVPAGHTVPTDRVRTAAAGGADVRKYPGGRPTRAERTERRNAPCPGEQRALPWRATARCTRPDSGAPAQERQWSAPSVTAPAGSSLVQRGRTAACASDRQGLGHGSHEAALGTVTPCGSASAQRRGGMTRGELKWRSSGVPNGVFVGSISPEMDAG